MRKVSLKMEPSKETENKLRWSGDVQGVAFKLYIPKWRVPLPWPARIEVSVYKRTTGAQAAPELPLPGSPELERPIIVIVKKVQELGHTVKYEPVGPSGSWETGQPYVPYALLSKPPEDRLRLVIRWDRSARPWRHE